MANSACKYCGGTISWAREDGKWIPMDPETGLSHRSSCAASSAGGAVMLKTGHPKKAFSQQFNENTAHIALEKRVSAIEQKLGMLTHQPFKGLK